MRSAEKCAKKHRVFAKEKYVFFIQRRSTVVYLLREEAECRAQSVKSRVVHLFKEAKKRPLSSLSTSTLQ